MGLFDNIRNLRPKKNAVQINEIPGTQNFLPFFFPHKKGDKPLGNVFFQSILNLLWQGISNVTYSVLEKKSITAEGIVNFIERNAVILVNTYIRKGYIVVFYDKNGNYRIPNDNEIKTDANGRVINKFAVVYYSPQYQSERTSLYFLSLPLILDVNKMAGTNDYLTETLGTMGILSGKDMPFSPSEKENMLNGMEKNYGVADGKYKYLITNNPVEYTPIKPDIKSLEFREKIKDDYMFLCNLYGIPLQLIFNDSSTFNNVKEARIFFYNNTVRFWAEVLLKIARELLTASDDFLPKSIITYRITNVPEMETTLAAACEQRLKYLEYLNALKESGLDIEKQLFELQEESKNLFKEI